MTARRLSVLVALALTAGGCGGGPRVPPAAQVPLVPGAQITVRQRRCNEGANPYCALQLVVSGPSYASADALLAAERALLKHRGWSSTLASNGLEHAAYSPGNRLRLTYATATSELQGIDLGWIRRAAPVARALSESLFAHTPTLSLLLQFGS